MYADEQFINCIALGNHLELYDNELDQIDAFTNDAIDYKNNKQFFDNNDIV